MNATVELGPDTAVTGKGLSIANKLLGIALLLIAMLATVVAIGGYQMSRIGDELERHQMP